MIISGIEKFTLNDYPGKIACTIFLFGCNLRCKYCHNPELVLSKPRHVISKEEILSFLEKRKGLLEGVCITGGEPLLNLDKEFVRSIKNLGYLIKIDTNGTNPNKLQEFIDEKLVDFIAMDIKNPLDKYSDISTLKVNPELLAKSIKVIASSGIDYEFRTTILKKYHDKKSIDLIGSEVVNLIGHKAKKYALQGFFNQGKFIDESFINESNTDEKYLNELAINAKNYFDEVCIHSYSSN